MYMRTVLEYVSHKTYEVLFAKHIQGWDPIGMFYTKVLITTEICIIFDHVCTTNSSIITVSPTLSYICVHCFNLNIWNSAPLIPQHVYLYCDLFYYCTFLKKGEVTSLKVAR
jgi:hypothetical protein